MLSDMTPFRMIGNVYFVGTYNASSHIIDTGEGLMMIDTGYPETADVILDSMSILGFDIKDVKYIIISHGHADHSGGVPKLKALSGAKVFMCEADLKYITGFLPDVYIHDGDVIRLGNTEILCLETPGHTEGAASFFFDVTEDGKTYRAGMFGGAGIPQLRKDYMDQQKVCYQLRGEFFRSVERLKKEHVDVFIGNHASHNCTRQKYEKSLEGGPNPFIGPEEWEVYLEGCRQKLEQLIETEITEQFVNYAHRGASEYLPENTMMAFYTGLYMGANGIETDVRLTKDGVPVLFHDDTLERVTGEAGSVADYTYEELRAFTVKKDDFYDRIPTLTDFLEHFAFRDLTFAIELKVLGTEKPVADLIRKYGIENKVVVTSFEPEYIRNIKAYAPELHVGLLISRVKDGTLGFLKAIRADEICPKAANLTPELVESWHREGFRVRVWGVSNEERMKHAFDCGVDGMTVNFPDKLTALRK